MNPIFQKARRRSERLRCSKLYDGPLDFSRLDTSRCTEHEADKGKLYGLKTWSKALKRMVSLAVCHPDEGRTDKWQLYFSTDRTQSTVDVLEYYRMRFQLESASETANSTLELRTVSPLTLENWPSTSTRRLRKSILPRPLAKEWEYRILSPHASR